MHTGLLLGRGTQQWAYIPSAWHLVYIVILYIQFLVLVTGWLEETVYVTENSTVEVAFGTVRGILSQTTVFGVDISNNSAS